MSFYLLIDISTIVFMAFCFTRFTSVLCKIIAIIFIFLSVLNLLWALGFLPMIILVAYSYLMHLVTVANALFAVQLFRTASNSQSDYEQPPTYNYIIGLAFIAMVLFSIPQIMHYFESGFFNAYFVRIWPDIIVVIAVAVMKIKKVSLNKDEDLLLWYFGVFCALMSLRYFL
jgi:hypothetical protein